MFEHIITEANEIANDFPNATKESLVRRLNERFDVEEVYFISTEHAVKMRHCEFDSRVRIERIGIDVPTRFRTRYSRGRIAPYGATLGEAVIDCLPREAASFMEPLIKKGIQCEYINGYIVVARFIDYYIK